MATSRPLTLALDVGGSHITAGLVDRAARTVICTVRQDVPHTAPAHELLHTWSDVLYAAADGRAQEVSHIGIAVPSPFDTQQGTSQMRHKFAALRGRPLRPELSDRLARLGLPHLPIAFGNDADLFTLGEWWAGAARGCQRVIGVTLGTGLGSGFVETGRIITWGENVPENGELWNTRINGMMAEDLVSGRALMQLGVEHVGRALSPERLADAARAGVAEAQTAFTVFGTALGSVLAPWVLRFQPDRVVLGGNVSRAADLFLPAAGAGLPSGLLRQGELFESAALLGAAAL